MNFKITYYILLSLTIQVSYSQTSEKLVIYDNFFHAIKTLDFKKSDFEISKKPLSNNRNLNLFYKLFKDNGQTQLKKLHIKINSNESIDKTFYNLTKAYFLLLYQNERIKSYTYFQEAFDQAIKTQYPPLIKLCLRSILKFELKKNLQSNNSFKKILAEYKDYCIDKEDFFYYFMYSYKFAGQTEIYDEKKAHNSILYNKIFNSYDSLINKYEFKNLLMYYHIDKGNQQIRTNPNYAKKEYLKSLKLIDSSSFYKPYKYIILSNLSRVSSLLEQHRNGINYLDLAKRYINKNDSIKDQLALAIYRANHFNKLNKYDSAYYLSEKIRKLGYLYNFQKENIEISRIREELKTEKKEKENLQLKQDNLLIESKRKQSQNLLYGSLAFLFLSGTIGLLTLKNSRKKRLLAEQQKELEKQKSLTLIKEQEINSINAMIDGQEKERIRIAEDLHDNIGSVLATLKLHFENLKLNREKEHFDQDELYAKTEKLIDETYLKVRSIAHVKNAGVIANKGLLVAVKLMAEKISDANKIAIHVLDFGLNKRLENQLEITIFRIIQELITNIIKHANATEATINISLFDKNLNIIIEDNGQGFDYDKIDLKNNMGISSIQTRIKHLKGSFEVDSTIDKGTSIILNIPV
ncbi:sensor histidine kinase [Tenacibaculum aiptasiae]|uniref:sensor histidine kinase n=1 Tax=Tenacibaculum aiptasiae TaxID=426481 RepID=UPI003B5C7F02